MSCSAREPRFQLERSNAEPGDGPRRSVDSASVITRGTIVPRSRGPRDDRAGAPATIVGSTSGQRTVEGF
jgi:hypothetical protein